MQRVLFVVLIALAFVGVHAQSSSDKITYLPGYDREIKFAQYAGYVNVNEETGRNLFYWFTESQNNPATDPVILWLNGGPGCSSLGGFFEELGPFTPRPTGHGNDTKLELNPYSWNNVANVIFLESPSGVGFSYSTNTSDYNVGDVRTANDSYNFLLQFFQMYPQFAKNPFWVTGESYGGHYVPNLAQRIIVGNGENAQKINLVGFMAGNAWTDAPLDNLGAVIDWYTHSLISENTYNVMVNACDFYNIGPLKSDQYDPATCTQYQQIASTEMGNIDIYEIYSDVCLTANSGHQLMKHLAASESKLAAFAKDRTYGMEPCEDGWLTNYLNQADVKSAIHASPTIEWVGCSSVVNYSYTDLLASMLPVYQFLLKTDIQMIVYSGDVDGIVPTPGTKLWLDQLALPITEAWRPWIGTDGQVAGYTTGFQGLRFLTVRGAGHLVPGTQPGRALNFFERIIAGKPL